MARRAEYCVGCPSRLSVRGVIAQGTAEGCGGRVRVLPGEVVTHIDGTKVVRPVGNVARICGRRWSGIEAGEGEQIVTTPGYPHGTDILLVRGADPGFSEETDDGETKRLVRDYDAELNRGGVFPTRVPEGTPTRGHLAFLSGGADVGHVRAVVSSVATDDFLGRLQLDRQTAEAARALVAAELDGSDSPLAAGIIALAHQVTVELDNTIEHELAMREQGEAYLGDIS